MSRLDQVVVIPRSLKPDSRGWFLKVIDGKESNLPQGTGEVYLTLAAPGQVRGNHYHLHTAEWFTVVLGNAQLLLYDLETRETKEFFLDASTPVTIYVPSGIAHAFKNPEQADETMLLVAYTDRLYEPEDVIPMKLL